LSPLCSGENGEWDLFVAENSGNTFHTTLWRDLLVSEYSPQFSPRYLVARDGRGAISGILPAFLVDNLAGRRLISLPCSIYGGPLWSKPGVLEALLRGAVAMGRESGANGVVIKGFHGGKIPVGDLPFDLPNPNVRSKVPLEGGSKLIWSRLSKGVRRSVGRSLRQGLEFSVSSEPEDFIQIHHLEVLTRRRQGLPVPSRAYFKSIGNSLGPEGAMVMLAGINDEPVAGIMAFNEGNSLLGVYAASDPARLKVLPNNFLLWHVLEWACSRGYESFDMGITMRSNTGLLEFKRRWGTIEEDAYQLHHPGILRTSKDPSILRSGFIRGLYSRVPEPIYGAVGPWIIRQLTS
jgi:hypothetical protein